MCDSVSVGSQLVGLFGKRIVVPGLLGPNGLVGPQEPVYDMIFFSVPLVTQLKWQQSLLGHQEASC